MESFLCFESAHVELFAHWQVILGIEYFWQPDLLSAFNDADRVPKLPRI